jgi:uncharacterized membrane protein YsdA (DUF1294 family)
MNAQKHYTLYILALGVTALLIWLSNTYLSLSKNLSIIIGINAAALLFMGFDKARSETGKFRIPEKILFIWAIAGGTIGIFLGSQIFNHKTRKASFNFILFLIFAIQVFLFRKMGFSIH